MGAIAKRWRAATGVDESGCRMGREAMAGGEVWFCREGAVRIRLSGTGECWSRGATAGERSGQRLREHGACGRVQYRAVDRVDPRIGVVRGWGYGAASFSRGIGRALCGDIRADGSG